MLFFSPYCYQINIANESRYECAFLFYTKQNWSFVWASSLITKRLFVTQFTSELESYIIREEASFSASVSPASCFLIRPAVDDRKCIVDDLYYRLTIRMCARLSEEEIVDHVSLQTYLSNRSPFESNVVKRQPLNKSW